MSEPVTSAERAVGTLREVILSGELPAGARLGEAELAERLGVSRTPVREALSRLAAEGLVDIVANRGARVATWTVEELEGVFELRLLLEPQLTSLAVPRATPEDADALEVLAHQMFEVGCPGPHQDLDSLVPLNRTFHERLVTIADHAALAGALASAIHPPIVARNFHAYDGPALRRSLGHHLEIVTALRAGDAEWARSVMAAHICNARAVMLQAARDESTADPTPADPTGRPS
ncbi:FCD domain-containing protein [Modestobacter sp. I12A-02628]|uniref:GntR family transcriptional regulator n=1 Tax=Goekera deserti TaxID=2497753 RepID=A0A7K3WG90_9ACTN|nr:GntR family transcriptional regulator [Goekera deserti]MPQ96601.1 FCD domain-containing protein [Goekera deserti]NDI47087.1 FCD domain-containing protein [Goekera deserti]NEL55515.1 GntR family transcriptional regulator [Goekera deserti]